MNSQPDVKRSYDSPLRKAQAAATRRAIIDAAATAFIERGYVATSIETIADAAGVSRATVFTSVGGKKELLKKAYDVALVGDDEPIPFPLRPASLAVRAEPDPRLFLVGYSGLLIDMYSRLAPIYEAVRGAASADPEVRDVFEAIVTERRIGAGNHQSLLRRCDYLAEPIPAFLPSGQPAAVGGCHLQVTGARVLRQVAHRAAAVDRAGERAALTGEDLERRGFARAVAPDETDAVAGLHAQVGLGQQDPSAGAQFHVKQAAIGRPPDRVKSNLTASSRRQHNSI